MASPRGNYSVSVRMPDAQPLALTGCGEDPLCSQMEREGSGGDGAGPGRAQGLEDVGVAGSHVHRHLGRTASSKRGTASSKEGEGRLLPRGQAGLQGGQACRGEHVKAASTRLL